MKIHRSLPDIIWSKGMDFRFDPKASATGVIPSNVLYRKVKVLPKSLEGKTDLFGNKYKPNEYIFVYKGSFRPLSKPRK